MDLARRRIQEIRAAHYVGYALRGIVDHHRELVRVQAVGTMQNKVADVPLEHLAKPALHAVREADFVRPSSHPQGAAAVDACGATGAGVDVCAVDCQAER